MGPWMTKAETALRTGQPRLAELYMRRGLSESRAGRSWLVWRDFVDALEAMGFSSHGLARPFGSAGVLP